jgi:hypothetical protein
MTGRHALTTPMALDQPLTTCLRAVGAPTPDGASLHLPSYGCAARSSLRASRPGSMCCATEDGTWETRHSRGHPSLRIPADREHQFQSIVIIGSGGHDRVGKGKSAADSLRYVACSLVHGTKESAGSRIFGRLHCSNRAAADPGGKGTRARELGATEERYLRRDRRSAKSGGIASSGSGGTSGTLSRTRLRSSGVALPARR